MYITSSHNPRIKHVIHLREKRVRDREGLFLVEGFRELKRFTDKGLKAIELFICPSLFLGENENELIDIVQARGAEVLQCDEKLFRKISYRDRPDGLLAIAPQKKVSLEEFFSTHLFKKNPFLVIAQSIEKPGNLGTILRSCDAAGVDGLIICDQCTDIHNPNVVRASVGTLFTVPVIEAKSEDTLKMLKLKKIATLAATPQAEQEFTEVDLTQGIAIAVGTEQYGLSKEWMSQADILVKIPMFGVADSLNVAMATTLLLYECIRQRK